MSLFNYYCMLLLTTRKQSVFAHVIVGQAPNQDNVPSLAVAPSCHAHAGVAAWLTLPGTDASAVTHPQQLLVLLLQLAFQVPHSLLNAPVTLFRLQLDHRIDRTRKKKAQRDDTCV